MSGSTFLLVLGLGFVVVAAGSAMGVTLGKRRRAQLDREAGHPTLAPDPPPAARRARPAGSDRPAKLEPLTPFDERHPPPPAPPP